jgi:hypothetical protein
MHPRIVQTPEQRRDLPQLKHRSCMHVHRNRLMLETPSMDIAASPMPFFVENASANYS